MTPEFDRRASSEKWRSGVDRDIGLLKRDVQALQNQESSYLDWKDDVNAFMTTFNATQARIEKEQKERHQQNQERLDSLTSRIGIGNLIIAALGLLLAGATAVIAYQAGAHRAQLDPTHLFSHSPDTTAEYQTR